MKELIIKKFILPVLGILASIGVSNFAHAEELNCGMTYDVKGGGLELGIGYFTLKGTGVITCEDVHGNKDARPVNVRIGAPAGEFAAGWLHMHGASGSFGFNGSMNDLYGSYAMFNANVALGGGAGVSFEIENPTHGFRISLGVTGSTGFGTQVGFTQFSIHPSTDELEDFVSDI